MVRAIHRERGAETNATRMMGGSAPQTPLDAVRAGDGGAAGAVQRSPDDPATKQKKQQAEMYLGSGYRRINALLAVLPEHRKTRDFAEASAPEANQLLPKWRAMAESRYKVSAELTAGWEASDLNDTLRQIADMHDVWDEYESPIDTVREVSRGDTESVLRAYPELAAATQGDDGEKSIQDLSIVWPGVLSTTVGDPKKHDYILGKKVIWKISLGKKHPGRLLPGGYISEQEVTFPVGTPLVVYKVLVRRTKSDSDGYGKNADVVLFARIPEDAPNSRDGKPRPESPQPSSAPGAPPPPPPLPPPLPPGSRSLGR